MKSNCFTNGIRNSSSSNIINFGDFPYINSPISKSQEKKIISKFQINNLFENLKIKYCSKCKHLKVNSSINQKLLNFFYSEFYNYPSFIKKKYLPKREKIFLEKFLSFFKKNKSKDILEIGCFDGILLKELKKLNYKVEGCEPSDGANIAKKNGIKVKKDFFKPQMYKKKFEIVIARHVLEHLEKPYFFIKKIKDVLNKDGYILIEVPNIVFYIRNGLLEVFSLQHLHYFTPQSMAKLFEDAGMEICKYYETPENLIFFAKKKQIKIKRKKIKTNINIKKFLNKIKKNKIKISKELEKFKNKNVLFWGAGGFFIAAINLYDIKPEISRYIIDSDLNKQNKFFLGNNLKILSPEKIKNFKIDLIIITSYYSNEIIKTIYKKKNILQYTKNFSKYFFNKS